MMKFKFKVNYQQTISKHVF